MDKTQKTPMFVKTLRASYLKFSIVAKKLKVVYNYNINLIINLYTKHLIKLGPGIRLSSPLYNSRSRDQELYALALQGVFIIQKSPHVGGNIRK